MTPLFRRKRKDPLDDPNTRKLWDMINAGQCDGSLDEDEERYRVFRDAAAQMPDQYHRARWV